MITAGVETTTKIYEWKRRSRSSPYKFELVQSIHNHRLKTRNTASYAQLNGFGLFRCEHRTSERVVSGSTQFCSIFKRNSQFERKQKFNPKSKRTSEILNHQTTQTQLSPTAKINQFYEASQTASIFRL